MSLANMKKIGRVTAWNVGAVFVISILAELSLGSWIFSHNFHHRYIDYVSCKNEITYWSYCPETVAINRMAPEDGGEWIENYVNKSNVRVRSEGQMAESTNFSEYSLYITGDSFIQADEVQFEETIGHWVEQISGRKTLHHGYSSWAVIQYMNYLTTIPFKSGDDVVVYLNLTDLSPENHNTNMKWYNYPHRIEGGKVRFTIAENDAKKSSEQIFLKKLKNNSFFFQIYIEIAKRIESNSKKKRGPEQFSKYKDWDGYVVFDDIIDTPSSECALLEKEYSKVSSATLDFLVYAFRESCWPASFSTPYQSAITDLNKLADHVSSHDANLHVLLFPMGWSFSGENMVGKQHPYYAMGERAIITVTGILPALQRDIRANVISVEEVLKGANGPEKNDLYFSVDGHWTAKAQKVLGAHLAEYLSNTE